MIASKQAIIFDMDGVLYSSSDCHALAFAETLAKEGVTDFSYLEVAGMGTEEAIAKVLSARGKPLPSSVRLAELTEAKRRRALELLDEKGKVAPGSKKAVTALAKSYRLAIASSASEAGVKLFLKKSRYQSAFEFWLHRQLVERAKPAPDLYLLALERLNLPAKRCVVVEDAALGVQAAIAAGIEVIGITGTEERYALQEAGAAVVVDRLAEIEQILASR